MPDRRMTLGAWLRLAAIGSCLAVSACNSNRPAKDEGSLVGPQSLALTSGQCSLLGNFRAFNDDTLAAKDLPGSTLYLAADGMGGEVGSRIVGKVACERAIEILTRELKKLPATATRDEVSGTVRRAIVAANEEVISSSARDPDLRNMGATVVLALWHPATGMALAGVGDCRAYLIRDDKITQQTVDHTMAQALVEAGTISADAARTHRFRNVLWKYLGSREVGDNPEVNLLSLQPGDRVVLCTKGFHEVTPEGQILSCVRGHPDAQKCADALCQLALKAGSRGNISCLVIGASEK